MPTSAGVATSRYETAKSQIPLATPAIFRQMTIQKYTFRLRLFCVYQKTLKHLANCFHLELRLLRLHFSPLNVVAIRHSYPLRDPMPHS